MNKNNTNDKLLPEALLRKHLTLYDGLGFTDEEDDDDSQGSPGKPSGDEQRSSKSAPNGEPRLLPTATSTL